MPKAEPNFILAELSQACSTVQDFSFKAKIASTEYACFSQFPGPRRSSRR